MLCVICQRYAGHVVFDKVMNWMKWDEFCPHKFHWKPAIRFTCPMEPIFCHYIELNRKITPSFAISMCKQAPFSCSDVRPMSDFIRPIR